MFGFEPRMFCQSLEESLVGCCRITSSHLLRLGVDFGEPREFRLFQTSQINDEFISFDVLTQFKIETIGLRNIAVVNPTRTTKVTHQHITLSIVGVKSISNGFVRHSTMTLAHLKQNRTILPPYIPAMNCGVLRLLSISFRRKPIRPAKAV